MAKKSAMFHDLDEGIFGTFAYSKEQGTEDGYVYIYYVPLNSLTVEKHPTPIKKSHIHTVTAPLTGVKGVETDIVYVFRDDEQSLIKKFIGDLNQKKLEKALRENKDLKIQLATAKQEAQTASASPAQAVATARQLVEKKKDPEDPMSGSSTTRRKVDPFGEF